MRSWNNVCHFFTMDSANLIFCLVILFFFCDLEKYLPAWIVINLFIFYTNIQPCAPSSREHFFSLLFISHCLLGCYQRGFNRGCVHIIKLKPPHSPDRVPVAPVGPSVRPGPSRASWPTRRVSWWTSVPRTWWTASQRMTAAEEDT